MEERNIKALEELTKQSDEKYIELLKNNQLTKILRAIGLFPDQTITNDVLIITQKPEATCVKRMRDWNYYKRSVNKNEKAIKVISHYIEKYDQDFTDEQGNIYTKGVEKLKTDLGYLFDISQTNGKEYDYLNSNRENLAKHFDVVKTQNFGKNVFIQLLSFDAVKMLFSCFYCCSLLFCIIENYKMINKFQIKYIEIKNTKKQTSSTKTSSAKSSMVCFL